MKSLRTYVLCACISIYGINASAQEIKVPINEPNYNKAKLFGNLPDNIPVNVNSLATSLLNTKEGSRVSIVVAPSFTVQGTIVSTASKYDETIQSVVVRLDGYNGATFTFSRLVNTATGAISFAGRIISMQSGDLFELRNSGQQYTLVKKTFYELVNE
jgi:hypothetical protein